MIYIDPPYNTGNDFIYPDNYSESLADISGIHRPGRCGGQEIRHEHRGRWPLPLQVAEHDVSATVSREKSLRDDGVIFIASTTTKSIICGQL